MKTDDIVSPQQAMKTEVSLPKKPTTTLKSAGGYRPGAGRKKGSKNTQTILKEEAIREMTEKAAIKAEILTMLPANLRRSEKALQAAIKDINTEEVENMFKQRVALHSSKLLTAMLSSALGEQYLYKVINFLGDNGRVMKRHVRVTDPEEIQSYLDNPLEVEGSDYFYIATKAPDIMAINSLLDRFMGRPTTKVVGPTNPDGSDGPIKIISVNYSPGGSQVQIPAPEVHVLDVVKDVIAEENGD